MKLGFDNEKYTRLQSAHIIERIQQFGGKLYLELGGKLYDDFHASRVLPGFQPDSKITMLLTMKDKIEVLIAISADDIEKSKKRGDFGITYDADVLRHIDAFRESGLYVGSVVITKYGGQSHAEAFKTKLEALGLKVYRHYAIEGYPTNVSLIVSDEGYGKNDFVETERPLVLVTAPGPGSGKMAVCMSQLYQEHKRGVKAGYAKFETFPVWNLPLKHPVNVAYESATVDLDDVNMIDPYHLEAYGKTTVNYNRDIEVFPVLNTIFGRIFGTSPYKSPTDMGVNMVGDCIIDDAVCQHAAKKEVLRRYYSALCEKKRNQILKDEQIAKLRLLMEILNISDSERPCIEAARKCAQETGDPVCALELPDGRVVSGKTSSLLGPTAALLLNALKMLAGIEKNKKLIPPEVIGPVQDLKLGYLGNNNPRLHSDEVLVALSITAASDETARRALAQLPKLVGCEVHCTVILSQTDENILRRLKLNVSCDPTYQTKKLYHKR